MRVGCRRLVLVVAMAVGASAHADSFGGFSRDETTYLVNRNRVCPAPVAKAVSEGPCKPTPVKAIAASGYRRGVDARGPGLTVTGQGAAIEIRGGAARKLLRRISLTHGVGEVTGTFISGTGNLIAVEYRAKLLRRLVDRVVVVAIPRQAPAPVTSSLTPKPGLGFVLPAPIHRSKPMTRTLAAAAKHLRRRRFNKALGGYRAAVVLDSKDARAHYGVAVALSKLKKYPEAIATLTALGKLTHPEVPVVLVRARRDKAFDSIRGDRGFRKAIGLEGGVRTLTAYERLLGLGGKWERTAGACGEPGVGLSLAPRKYTFKLAITYVCGGERDTTTLRGTWMAMGESVLRLVFPNPGGDSEKLDCKLRPCQGEDCLACTLDAELSFELRAARR